MLSRKFVTQSFCPLNHLTRRHSGAKLQNLCSSLFSWSKPFAAVYAIDFWDTTLV
jgi:hypothetical protein